MILAVSCPVLVEGDVEHPVQGVLDGPVGADVGGGEAFGGMSGFPWGFRRAICASLNQKISDMSPLCFQTVNQDASMKLMGPDTKAFREKPDSQLFAERSDTYERCTHSALTECLRFKAERFIRMKRVVLSKSACISSHDK